MIINYPSKQRLILTDQYRHLHCCYRLAALISKSKKCDEHAGRLSGIKALCTHRNIMIGGGVKK